MRRSDSKIIAAGVSSDSLYCDLLIVVAPVCSLLRVVAAPGLLNVEAKVTRRSDSKIKAAGVSRVGRYYNLLVWFAPV